MTTATGEGLVVQGLSAGYGPVDVLHEVDLQVRPEEIVALLGANGAGKSTLVKTIGGLLPARAGSVHSGGRDVTRMRPERRARAGIVTAPEGRRLFLHMTVAENIELGLRLSGRGGGKALLDEVLDLLPVVRERMSTQAGLLSGGQQQMVALARAAAASPQVLLLDEPTLGLSPRLTVEVLDLVAELARRRSLAVLLVEQRAQQALAVATRGYVIDRGRIVLAGSSAELLGSGEMSEIYFGAAGVAPAADPTPTNGSKETP
ncbi:ATP-binding cassette domain-containing protein [Nakamurella sp. YIM 132087]|uniref:ATP-binding cassette domain-containing protein n=1 Tax=Nakamurella alba TaxID=2665158 RepID=A0A7K1FJF4_9ACTN|nr:ABC transporter ATP-binding protein [Nakamurella alba]MTD14200.1 ATP-binding cassette domain-containing protein [Nakamurella alba]